jgi:hypothetical protein
MPPSDHFLSQSTTKVVPLKRAAPSSFQNSRNKRTAQDAFNRIATVFESKMEGKPADSRPTAKTLALATLQAEYKGLDDAEFNQAIELLAIDTNVEVFNALKGNRRDGWLRAKIGIILIASPACD